MGDPDAGEEDVETEASKERGRKQGSKRRVKNKQKVNMGFINKECGGKREKWDDIEDQFGRGSFRPHGTGKELAKAVRYKYGQRVS